MKFFSPIFILVVRIIAISVAIPPLAGHCRIDSRSNGSDGIFSPTTNTVVDLMDHPTGIYNYLSVNIPSDVTVTFLPNANNTPVVWLVRSNIVINGVIDLSGKTPGSAPSNVVGGLGGPGGHRGGSGGAGGSSGHGPGSGIERAASFGTVPQQWNGTSYQEHTNGTVTYANQYLLPLIGGSGGGGVGGQNGNTYAGGGGGGGAFLIAASDSIELNGEIASRGGGGGFYVCGPGCYGFGGGGSGGAVRLYAKKIYGGGRIDVSGGGGPSSSLMAGYGRIRIDAFDDNFGGVLKGAVTRGYQPIILENSIEGSQLHIESVAGAPVSAFPSGQVPTPDVIVSSQQNNPVAVVVRCSNIPLNSQITVFVKPANALSVSATAQNSIGTLASSVATVLINMPRGGGIMYSTVSN